MSKVQIVWFRDLKLWSVALQNQTTLKSHFPLIELKEILVDLTEHRKITILDNEFYKEPTISSKTNEISIRKSGLGSEFKVKKRVKILKGDLVIAKMHTQNGLYAFANDEFASTTTFIPFKILENKINKNYLFILLKQTLARLQKFDSVNRETYKTDEILSLQIPLPPLEIQKQIVAKIESIKAQIKALQAEEKRLKDEIEAYIYIALGLEKKQELQRQKVFIVRFKDLDRWDTRHNQANQHAKTQIVFENLENLTTYMQRGKTPTYSTIKKYPVIAQKCVQWNGLEIQKALFINPDSLSSYTKERFLQDDDILLNSTGIGTLGRAIIYKSKDNPYNIAVADGHITVMRFDTQRILPQYFYHYFSSALIQDNIEEYATGSTKQKELSLTLIKQIKIPLPPLSVQEKIINAIEMIKAQIAIIDSKLESLETRKAQILESALSESNEREREQTELKEILIEIESLLLQKAFLQNLITQILQKVETPANLESLLDSIPTAYHTKHHTYRLSL